MFKRILITLALGSALASLHAQAPQQNQNADPSQRDEPKVTDTEQKHHFWNASVNGGNYMVKLERISAISRHQYVLDGAVIVDEVTVDALGQALARFYFIKPLSDAASGSSVAAAAARLAERGRNLAENAAERAGTDIHNMVVKKFPDTTHSHTLEYRLLSEAELSALYKSVSTALHKGRGRNFVVK